MLPVRKKTYHLLGKTIIMEKQMDLLWSRLKEELQKQTEIIAATVNETITTTIEEKLKPIKKENEALKNKVEVLSSKIQGLELENRKNNVIIHGVEEGKDNHTGLMEVVLEILNEVDKTQIKHEWDRWEISKAHRIGKKCQGKDRPIKITLTLGWRKAELLKNRSNFPQGIKITEDFPKEILASRKALIPKLIEARESGKYAIIKNDRLIIREKSETGKNKEKRKRAPSSPLSTPPNNFSRAHEQAKGSQNRKISKINPFEEMRNRTNSRTEDTQAKNN